MIVLGLEPTQENIMFGVFRKLDYSAKNKIHNTKSAKVSQGHHNGSQLHRQPILLIKISKVYLIHNGYTPSTLKLISLYFKYPGTLLLQKNFFNFFYRLG